MPRDHKALYKKAKLRSLFSEVREIYAMLEERPLERSCIRRTQCCRFQLTGEIPYLTRGEALLIAGALRASGRKRMPTRSDGACPLLSSDPKGSCHVYSDRHFPCRTHYCNAAGGPRPRKEILDLIHRLESLDARLGGRGPITLPKAIPETLRLLE